MKTFTLTDEQHAFVLDCIATCGCYAAGNKAMGDILISHSITPRMSGVGGEAIAILDPKGWEEAKVEMLGGSVQ